MASTCKRGATMMKSSLIRINLTFIFLVLSIPNLVTAETKTFIKEYTYQASEADSKISSRVIALEQVKRLLLEELGTYLESHTEIVNFQLEKDQITALTAGVVQTQIIKEKWDGERYWIQAKIEADAGKVAKDVDALRKDRDKSRDLEAVRKKADDLSREVEKLRKELELSKKDQTKVVRYDEAVKELSATDFVQRAYSLSLVKKYEEAINIFTKAIELNPKYAEAFAARGLAYSQLNNYKQAFDDLNIAIEQDPKNVEFYYARAAVYLKSGKHQRSIEDLGKVIELNPKLTVDAYSLRGIVYYDLGNYNQAIRDYSKAIELDPKDKQNDARVYIYRGLAYGKMGNYNQAMKDLNRAIELNPKLIEAYLNRGDLYDLLVGNYKKAMKDYNRAIELDPKAAYAYYFRGNSYDRHGNKVRAIQDFKVAARLGHQEAQAFLKKEGIDWAPEIFPSVTSSDKLPQKPATAADDPYKKIKAIVLKNGDVIEGKILSWNPEIVKIRTKDGKVLSYDFKNDVQTFITDDMLP
jgi:tetratricopeptide (TPR) repeat protein